MAEQAPRQAVESEKEHSNMNTPTTARSDFATRLYDKLATTQAGNLFLSPFSIRVALAMCAVGARGETRRVLADLIGAPESSMSRTDNTLGC
jgi:serine protease inhibitor